MSLKAVPELCIGLLDEFSIFSRTMHPLLPSFPTPKSVSQSFGGPLDTKVEGKFRSFPFLSVCVNFVESFLPTGCLLLTEWREFPSLFFCSSTLSLGTDKLVLFSLDLSVRFRLAFRLGSEGLSLDVDSD